MHVTGQASTEYVSEETPMAVYANLHVAFEQMRVRALMRLHGSPVQGEEANVPSDPPRVLILGPENSGKTTVCKILANYAVRAGQGWCPILVNVDPNEVRLESNLNSVKYTSYVPIGGVVSARSGVCCSSLWPHSNLLPSKPTGVGCVLSANGDVV